MHICLCCGQSGKAIIIGECTTEPVQGDPVRLENARMVLYWSEECKGLFGLCANGPKPGTRLTPTVDTVVETVWQEWIQISEETARLFKEWTE